MRLTWTPATVLAVTLLTGCAGQGYVAPELLEPPVGQFTRAMASFADDARKQHLATYRRDVRHDLFTQVLVPYVESNAPSDDALRKLLTAMQPDRFLCLPRYAYLRVSLRLGNLEAVGTALGARLEAPSDDLGKLFKALGTNYAISTHAQEPPRTYDEWVTANDGKGCIDSVKNGDPYATRNYIGSEFAFAAIPAAISTIQTIWTVLKPVLVGTLQNVDLERRNAAIRAYFADQKNSDALKKDLSDTETYLAKELELNRRRAAGRAAATAAMLLDPSAAHWTKIKSIAGSKACREAVASQPRNNSAPALVGCLDEAMMAAKAQLDRALDSADKFDGALDLQLPKDRLSDQVDTLRKIAIGEAPTDDQLKALWAASIRYAALFKTVNDATSAANQKKISDALADFLKAVK